MPRKAVTTPPAPTAPQDPWARNDQTALVGCGAHPWPSGSRTRARPLPRRPHHQALLLLAGTISRGVTTGRWPQGGRGASTTLARVASWMVRGAGRP